MIAEFPRQFYKAYKEALKSPGIGGRKSNRFRLGASIADKKRVLVARFNCLKTNPNLLPFNEWPFLHAEANAILSLGMNNCKGLELYVIRIQKDNTIALAMPCSKCCKLITTVGIKKVYYSISDTTYGVLIP